MARIRNVPEIGDMVKALGDLMRASISGDDFITLNDEITNITNYLKIQKFRYGDRLGVCIDISPDIGRIVVPKLILQPIVENSIVHGLEEKLEDGHIDISGMLFALIFMSDDNKMTLPVSLTRFKGQYSTSWTIQLAAVVIMVLPSLITYFFLNDKIIKSLTIGAVKG